jgi:tetratricopeptide (TPR) repeat protein
MDLGPAGVQAGWRSAAPSEPPDGGLFGPWRVAGRLGSGAMGTIYRAEHVQSGQSAALKTLPSPRAEHLPRIRREIHALTRIRHPGIVRILDSGLREGLPWYAMELVEGQTLRRFGSGRPASTAPERLGRLRVVRALCGALAYLHGEGLIHRDLKPDNVLLRPDGQPVLVDFGLASDFGGALSREALGSETGSVGTPLYMAPEQIRGELLDARADLYALGCILYELLSGRPPFESLDARQVLQAHLHLAPSPPSRHVPELPSELDALVLGLLAKSPRERIGYADDVAAELERLGAEDGFFPAAPRPRAYLYRPGFVGRDEALRRLQRHLMQRQESGGSGLVLVGGESGVGKTRLVLELARRAEKGRLQVYTGECLPAASESGGRAGAGGPLHPLRRWLQSVADLCREGGIERTERLLGPRGPILAAYEPALNGLPGQERHTPAPELPPDAARLRLFSALLETLAALIEPGTQPAAPLLLILDDLQWADDLTLGFLEHFLRAGIEGASGRAASVVVGTYRTEEVGTGHASPLQRLIDATGMAHVLLGRLDEASVAAMVSHMLGLEAPPQSFSRSLARHSEGNPFFVAEYLRTAVGEGMLVRDRRGRWRVIEPEAPEGREVDACAALPLPGSLRELVGRRLQVLPPEALALAEAAAVLGREAPLPLLETIGGLDEDGLLAGQSELLRRQVLEAGEPERLRFVHDKIREVAYASIPMERRSRLHRAAAEAIEEKHGAEPGEQASVLGHHWERAGEPLRAARHWVEAGRRSASAYAVQEALDALDKAIAVLEPVSTDAAHRSDLLRALDARSRVRDQIGHFAEGAEDARRMAELARAGGDGVHLGRALRQWGLCCYNSGDYQRALEHYQEALSVLERERNPEEVCETRSWIAWVYSSRAEFETALSHFQKALGTPGLAGDSPARLTCLLNLGITLHQQGRLHEGLDILQGVLARHMERKDPLNVARCKLQIGLFQSRLGDEAQALALYEEAREVFERLCAVQLYLVATNNIGVLQIQRGSFEQAALLFEDLSATARRYGEIEQAAVGTVQLCICELWRGHVAAAVKLAASAVETFQKLGNRRWLQEGHLWEGCARATAGDSESSDRCFAQGLEIARSLPMPIETWKTCIAWANALREREGTQEQARRLAEEALQVISGTEYRTHGLVARLVLDLLRIHSESRQDQAAAWKSFGRNLARLKQDVHRMVLRRSAFTREALQTILLASAELALQQGRDKRTLSLLTAYRSVADPEHLLHERRAALLGVVSAA